MITLDCTKARKSTFGGLVLKIADASAHDQAALVLTSRGCPVAEIGSGLGLSPQEARQAWVKPFSALSDGKLRLGRGSLKRPVLLEAPGGVLIVRKPGASTPISPVDRLECQMEYLLRRLSALEQTNELVLRTAELVVEMAAETLGTRSAEPATMASTAEGGKPAPEQGATEAR